MTYVYYADGLLYLPEIKYRRILNRAFGPGGKSQCWSVWTQWIFKRALRLGSCTTWRSFHQQEEYLSRICTGLSWKVLCVC